MSDWISVNDKMPECGRIVLTREEKSYRPPVSAILNREGCFDGWSITHNDFVEGTGLKVTHWMLIDEVTE